MNDIRESFLKSVLGYAKEARAQGLFICPAAVAAQAALESAFGQSRLAVDANNLFGIKATKSWTGPVVEYETKEFTNDEWVTITSRFRKYDSYRECVFDYASIINRLPWYKDAVEAAKRNDDDGFIDGLLASPKQPGWATDPKYGEKIKKIMKQYNLKRMMLTV